MDVHKRRPRGVVRTSDITPRATGILPVGIGYTPTTPVAVSTLYTHSNLMAPLAGRSKRLVLQRRAPLATRYFKLECVLAVSG